MPLLATSLPLVMKALFSSDRRAPPFARALFDIARRSSPSLVQSAVAPSPVAPVCCCSNLPNLPVG
ncbi:UNVERIFIED_CONTAM: hypothetical protein Sangu_3115000 [Sesamum angustifolium]|uniref:Uncharacterized protein n=1 Tax=Sesamum angustifolium TaxID=2727405 RepID=A0AAW2K708_9LAMI